MLSRVLRCKRCNAPINRTRIRGLSIICPKCKRPL